LEEVALAAREHLTLGGGAPPRLPVEVVEREAAPAERLAAGRRRAADAHAHHQPVALLYAAEVAERHLFGEADLRGGRVGAERGGARPQPRRDEEDRQGEREDEREQAQRHGREPPQGLCAAVGRGVAAAPCGVERHAHARFGRGGAARLPQLEADDAQQRAEEVGGERREE
jgi:hypothetical protein